MSCTSNCVCEGGMLAVTHVGHSRQKLNIYDEFCPNLCIHIICIFSLPFFVKMHIVNGLSTRA